MTVPRPAIARTPAGLALVVAVLAAGAHAALYRGSLPEQVASHFEMSGRADGWMDKGSLLLLYAVLVVGIGALFAGLALLLPRVPDALLSVPQREVWLAAARRDETLAWISRWMLWLGAGTVAFIALVMHLTFRANLDGTGRLGGSFWFVLGAFLGGTLGGCVRMLLKFRRVPRGEAAGRGAGARGGAAVRRS